MVTSGHVRTFTHCSNNMCEHQSQEVFKQLSRSCRKRPSADGCLKACASNAPCAQCHARAARCEPSRAHDGLVEAVIYCVRSGQAAMQGHEGMVLAHMTATQLAATSCFAAPGGEGLISAAWNRALRGATNTCVNTSFSMSTPAALTPVFVCQHLLLKARSCVNINNEPLR